MRVYSYHSPPENKNCTIRISAQKCSEIFLCTNSIGVIYLLSFVAVLGRFLIQINPINLTIIYKGMQKCIYLVRNNDNR